MNRLINSRRVTPPRKIGWDYGSPGYYFVTLCTKGRRRCMSTVTDAGVSLTPIGRIVAEEWYRTASMNANAVLDRFVVMPDHFQAIMRLLPRPVSKAEIVRRLGGSGPAALSDMIRFFKASVTRRVTEELQVSFDWQRGFHDRVIRVRSELEAVRAYIANNPREWKKCLTRRM